MMLEVCWDGLWTLSIGFSQFHGRNSWLVCEAEPYIGCPYPCPPIPMGFGWAWVQCYCSWVGMGVHGFCASLHPTPNRSLTSGCREDANQEALHAEANDNERPFICPIQPILGVGG